MILFLLSVGLLTIVFGALLYLVFGHLKWRFRGGILILLSSLYSAGFFLLAKLNEMAWL